MSDGLRIVSLAPSATATLTAMGAADDLVGGTIHGDFDGPTVGGWLNPEYDRVAALDPDLVCTADALQTEIRDELRERGYAVHHSDPRTLDEVVESFGALADAAGHAEAGTRLVERSRDRIARIRDHVADDDRPTVYCEEWSDPPMAAGNWVPDVVVAAGGSYPFVDAGERSREIDRETVEAAEPDHVVLHLCGRGDRVDPNTVRERGWVLDARVHVVDDSLLNQPSPRLIDGIETLAERLHGSISTGR